MAANRRLYFSALPQFECLLDETGVSPSAVVQAVYAAHPELFRWAALRLSADGVSRAAAFHDVGCRGVGKLQNASTTATNSHG
jgi:hypothetical protein